jgi:putative oxidoreductase
MNLLPVPQTLAHGLFRVAFGFAYMTHGAQKLFGWFGGRAVGFSVSEYTAAGIIEFTAGALIMLGFRTRTAAFIASGEMAVAYFWKHAMSGDSIQLFHWQNRGELPLLFAFAFLLLSSMGSGPYSLDAMTGKKSA